MLEFMVTIGLGVFVCVLGVIHMTGNISSLHWYHRQRVTEENRKPFGKLVGLGTLIIGIALLVFGILSMVSEYAHMGVLALIGGVELIVGVVVGIAISFYAMFKYNKGIF